MMENRKINNNSEYNRKMENRKSRGSKDFVCGLKAGVPIGLGYLSVSFTFGIIAVSYGFYWWQAVMISMLNLTSAGQFAGIGIMQSPGQYVEMFISQLTINIRYSFMTIALSQKTNPRFRGIYRWILGAATTDEIFAVAVAREEVSRSYYFGLMVIPYFGWTLGTLMGAVLGNILPPSLISALGLAIYSMFVAIVIPEMKKVRAVVYVVAFALAMSCLFAYLPSLKAISTGISVSICAVTAAAVGAVLFPRALEE